jgi:hypothetical protein
MLWSSLSWLLLLWAGVGVVQASIQIVETGKEYASRPDKSVGLQLQFGIEYAARLQQIPGNTHLCYDRNFPKLQNWNVTVPDDGLPGIKPKNRTRTEPGI